MNTNDVICLGAKPLFFLDYIACGKVKPQVLKEVISGVHKGLRDSFCALIGGETAEMPGMYGQDEYDLAGFCVGIVDRDKIIDGSNIKEGDLIIGLASSGLHSNGFSLARKALGEKGVRKYARELLRPTRIYVKPVLNLLQATCLAGRPAGYRLQAIKGIAHITGGAFYKKAIKILPQGHGMVIGKKSWNVPEIFRIIQAKGAISDREMYTVFNMGIGMILVVKSDYTGKILSKLAQLKINSQVIGEIVKSNIAMRVI
jgi:phosphoribosylformylglycinamidine cyclo-ligase